MSQWVSMKQAGLMLGLSEDTVRRKIRAGDLVARQEQTVRGFKWLVEVPGEAVATPATPDAGVGARAESDSATARIQVLEEKVSNLQELVAELRSDKAWFKAQMAVREREIEQLHILLQRSQGSQQGLHLPPLEAPQRHPSTLASATAGILTDMRRSRWWRWMVRA